MTALALRTWRALHAVPWFLADRSLRYVRTSLIAVLVIWHVAGADHRWLIYAALVGLLIMSVGSDAPAGASSLLQTLKSSYRLARIRLTWTGTMHRAKLYETVHIEESLHSPRSTPGGRKVPRLKRWGRNRIRRTPCGVALVVDGSNIGAGVDAFSGEQAQVLKAKWKALDLIVDSLPGRPYLTRLRVIWVDPFAVTIRPSQLPAPPLPPRGLCPIGKDSDGAVVIKDARLPALIAGASGSGKSSECWMLLWSLLKQGLPFRTRAFDPKGGQEFFDLADKAYRYESDPTKWCAFLSEALAALAARQAALKALGLRKWDPVALAKLGKLDEFPLDVMIIDELVTVIAMMAGRGNDIEINGHKTPVLKAFWLYLSQIRAAGFTVIANTQLTQKEAIGVVRDLFIYITCLRVGSDEMVKVVLGDAKLYPAHRIPVGDDYGGIGYMATDKGPIKYRAAYLEDGERAEVARRIGLLTETQRKQAPAEKSKVIMLDLGSDELEVTEEEQAALDELVRVCSECQKEFHADTGELIMNGAAA